MDKFIYAFRRIEIEDSQKEKIYRKFFQFLYGEKIVCKNR